jgi:hypothetical protein
MLGSKNLGQVTPDYAGNNSVAIDDKILVEKRRNSSRYSQNLSQNIEELGKIQR